MTIWNRVQSILQKWRSPEKTGTVAIPDRHLLDAHRNIRELIEDTDIPASVRAELATEFDEIDAISSKLRNSEIHIAAFGRVGVGKSSLLNALLRKKAFSTSALHGETRGEERMAWRSSEEGNIVFIDTPGIDELDGETRAEMAHRVCRRADIVLMVCEADLTRSELQSLQTLIRSGKATLLVLNKADRYSEQETSLLLQRLRERCGDFLPPDRVIATCAAPRPQAVIHVDSSGRETEATREADADIGELKSYLWNLLEAEGRSLAALNAAMFASELDQKVATRIVAARKTVAEKIIRRYCVGKGLVVALNPVPITDLLAAAGGDVALVIHLGEVYGFRLSRREASKLLVTISAQMAALMGAYWGMNLLSSAMKTASAGLSTALTATTQGALAWYATYITGKMAQSWFSKGKSWGNAGPRETAKNILESLDRDSLMRQAREDIQTRLKRS
jgi:small GTP-binding protein